MKGGCEKNYTYICLKGKAMIPSRGKNCMFHPAAPLSWSLTLDGLFKLTQGLSRDLASYMASEKQGYIGAEIPDCIKKKWHNLLNTHLCLLFQKLEDLGSSARPFLEYISSRESSWFGSLPELERSEVDPPCRIDAIIHECCCYCPFQIKVAQPAVAPTYLGTKITTDMY